MAAEASGEKEQSKVREAPREQEQSIKARKQEIFEEEQQAETTKKFSAYLAETPPSPLSKAQKYTLGGIFGLVLLLLLVALLTRPAPRSHVHPTPKAPAAATTPAPHAGGH